MIANYLSAMWRAIAPAMGNHLWQSTLFAIAAGLLTVILRKNHARTRYGLWLAASMKFAIPFSLLIGLGSHLAWSRGSAGRNAVFYIALEEVGQPFTQPALPVIPQATPSTVSSILLHLLPTLLATVWLCGFLAVVFVWYARWRRVSNALRIAEPLREGREVDILRHLERIAGSPKHIEMFLSRTSLEPGIFGIVRPVLLWPAGISDRLEDAHLEVILAHELWHVRRRDNLAAALHMVVEAIFWFHPLVWWLGARLVEERERACDEAVLESGSDRHVYAESILKICEFCVGSPLACVSGVTGADLKKRMVHIMTKSASRKLDFTKKLLLSAFASAVIAIPIMLGLFDATQARAQSQAPDATAGAPTFEAVSITPNKNGEPMAGLKIKGRPMHAIMWKPDRFMATNFSLPMLLMRGYDVQADQIFGGPSWLNSENFDVEARLDQSSVEELARLSPDQGKLQRQRLLQGLLSDRFKLSFHHETKDLPVFALVVAANGLKLQPAKSGDTYPNGLQCSGAPCGAGVLVEPEKNKLVAQGVPISNLLRELSVQLGGRLVVDKTALMGSYDFTLNWPLDGNQDSMRTAIQEQLGLKLETQKLAVDVLVIDHAEMPSDSSAQTTSAMTSAYAAVSFKPNKSDNSTVGIASHSQNAGSTATVYEVVSLKPNQSGDDKTSLMYPPDGLTGKNVTVQMIIRLAYGVQNNQIFGAPNWVNSDCYDLDARMENSAADEMSRMTEDQRKLVRQRMLQALLADRFKLMVHREIRELPLYALVIAENGPKLHKATPGDMYENGINALGGLFAGPHQMTLRGNGEFKAQTEPVSALARVLSRVLAHPVVDRTGLTGNYDFTLQWTPSNQTPMVQGTEGGQQVTESTTPPNPSRPSIFTALEEQLGLKLESQNGPVEILVIDHVEKPSAN